MRIKIKTNGKVKDNDIKAIYLIREVELTNKVVKLTDALEGLMKGVRGLPPLTAIAGTLVKEFQAATEALKS